MASSHDAWSSGMTQPGRFESRATHGHPQDSQQTIQVEPSRTAWHVAWTLAQSPHPFSVAKNVPLPTLRSPAGIQPVQRAVRLRQVGGAVIDVIRDGNDVLAGHGAPPALRIRGWRGAPTGPHASSNCIRPSPPWDFSFEKPSGVRNHRSRAGTTSRLLPGGGAHPISPSQCALSASRAKAYPRIWPRRVRQVGQHWSAIVVGCHESNPHRRAGAHSPSRTGIAHARPRAGPGGQDQQRLVRARTGHPSSRR